MARKTKLTTTNDLASSLLILEKLCSARWGQLDGEEKKIRAQRAVLRRVKCLIKTIRSKA